MSTAASTLTFRASPATRHVATRASACFEWTMLLLSAWVMGGAYLDGWAHRHVASTLETFLTPWHAVLYSGVLATGIFLFVQVLRGRAAGRSWRTVLPIGYGLSFIGFVLFGISGNLDLGWHTLFGIERSYAATLSPTHLLLMLSAGLMITGGLRAAWSSPVRRLSYVGLVSATLLFGLFLFFSQDLHPFTSQWAAQGTWPVVFLRDQGEELGVVEVILQSGLLTGMVLYLISRFTLPRGALTIMLGLTTAAIVVIWKPDPVVIIGVAGGLIGDGLLAMLRPSPARPLAFHGFAFLLPAAIYLSYFLGLLKADGIWWPVHVWTGAVVVAGLTGLLVSYLIVRPVSASAAR